MTETVYTWQQKQQQQQNKQQDLINIVKLITGDSGENDRSEDNRLHSLLLVSDLSVKCIGEQTLSPSVSVTRAGTGVKISVAVITRVSDSDVFNESIRY